MVLPERGPLADDLRAAGTEVLIERLAVIRREHLHPRGAAGLGARTLRDGGALSALARRRGVRLIHSNTSAVLAGAPAAALAGPSPTSGTCARSTPVSDGCGPRTGACC